MSILRADSIRDRAGTGAPDFPNGLTGNVTGNVTGNADTATALSGTPNITVGIVTGTDATFSGNLTVNGTTTTIDTAVTAVDSLAVEGSVGIGTTIPAKKLEVVVGNTVNDGILLKGNSSPAIQIDEGSGVSANFGLDGNGSYFGPTSNHYQVFRTNSVERVRITSGGTSIFKAGLAEKSNRVASTLGSSPNNSITDGNIIFYAGGSESGDLTINFTDIHANLAEHECCSFTVAISPNNSGKITAVTIDGQTPADGLKWSGGSAPSAGASGVDIYTFTIRKYGTANTNYGVYGAATNYA